MRSIYKVLNRWSMLAKMLSLVILGVIIVMCLGLNGAVFGSRVAALAEQAAAQPEGCGGRAACLAEIKTQSEAAATRSIVLLALMLATLPASFMLVTISVVSRVRRAEAVAKHIAVQDLASPVDVEGSDEIGRLLAALEQMRSSLEGTVREVRSVTEQVANSSAEIASANVDLSQRTESQAARLQETAAAVREINGSVSASLKSSEEASAFVETARTVCEAGDEAMQRVIERMQRISVSSQRIADITAVIDGIAFQTNILALNAAVEAARAGDAGRGFAVVAAEVRNLATRSANAAKEIKGLIADASEHVNEGAALVDGAGQTMAEIKGSVARVHTIILELQQASAHQGGRIGAIDAATASLDTVTQSNAAMVEQCAASAQRVKALAEGLTASVGRFKLG